MKAEIQVSERWVEGFAKEAMAMGLTEAQVPALLKAANLKAARDANPQKFDEGVESVMGEKSALFWVPAMAAAGLGAMAYHGGRAATQGMGDAMYTGKMVRDVGRFNAQKARMLAQRNLLQSTVGPQPGQYGYGQYGYGGYGYPF